MEGMFETVPNYSLNYLASSNERGHLATMPSADFCLTTPDVTVRRTARDAACFG